MYFMKSIFSLGNFFRKVKWKAKFSKTESLEPKQEALQEGLFEKERSRQNK